MDIIGGTKATRYDPMDYRLHLILAIGIFLYLARGRLKSGMTIAGIVGFAFFIPLVWVFYLGDVGRMDQDSIAFKGIVALIGIPAFSLLLPSLFWLIWTKDGSSDEQKGHN